MKINSNSIISCAQEMMSNALLHQDAFKRIITRAEKQFKQVIEKYTSGEVTKGIGFTPTYLNVSDKDVRTIAKASVMLHDLIEKVFTALADHDENLVEHFKHHQHFFEFLVKQRGLWQFYGRYDFLIARDGTFKFCETNTSGGAGFWLNHYYNSISQGALGMLPEAQKVSRVDQCYEDFLYFAKMAIKTESECGFSPQLIAILHDDNNNIDHTSQVSSELFMLKSSFELCKREVIITHIRNLTSKNGVLCYQNRPISMTFNKFRLAGWNGGWLHTFREEYAAFLNGLQHKTFFTINGINPLVIGEDKGIFAVFTDPKFQYLFNEKELEFIETYLLWTRRLTPNRVQFALDHKDSLVAKPCNDRRGYGVVIGNACTAKEWKNTIERYVDLQAVIQKYQASIVIPTVKLEENELNRAQCYHTASSYLVDGKFVGLLSRLSEKNVSNISNGGRTQPIRIIKTTTEVVHEEHGKLFEEA